MTRFKGAVVDICRALRKISTTAPFFSEVAISGFPMTANPSLYDRFRAGAKSAMGREEPVMNDRWTGINWIAGKPTLANGTNRCEVEVRDNNPTDGIGRKPARHS